ncbi:hypothetical protein MHYP_G00306940 [Metynnis hypsauchen]
MSTGYEFDSGCKYHIASHLDRLVRVATAEVFPLGTYYPEPNFCVLVPKHEDHVPESFINTKRKNMESPILISRVKTRKDFRAVFLDGKPIIIDVPERFKLWDKGLQTNQSHLGKLSWARDVYVNGVTGSDPAVGSEDSRSQTPRESHVAAHSPPRTWERSHSPDF